ncbi:MAG: response regulator [Nanoarchaeota archaeon]|nr:response regulator [Nanoarchaeota archaeon]
MTTDETNDEMAHRPSLLFAEDNKDQLDNYREFFEDNYRVLCYATVIDTLAYLARNDVDVIISDYHLEDGDADDIFTAANERGIPSIITSRGKREGVNATHVLHVLVKPFDLYDLESLIKSCIADEK